MMTWQMLQGDVLARLAELPDDHFHCVVTSPPYWGLRDYQTGTWSGGSAECDHSQEPPRFNGPKQTRAQVSGHASLAEKNGRNLCQKCGASRTDDQIGNEPTPGLYVERVVAVFREVRRVLRPDGVFWLNIGDSYHTDSPVRTRASEAFSDTWDKSQTASRGGKRRSAAKMGTIKNKGLIGIPWMLALALRDDGWFLRAENIWEKPNAMTESVTDRPSRSHEQVFLFSKSSRYFYDRVAVMEKSVSGHRSGNKNRHPNHQPVGRSDVATSFPWHAEQRNRRTVWRIPTKSFKGAHFATYPPALVSPCIKAGTSEHGCCPTCGAPWKRLIEEERGATRPGKNSKLLLLPDNDYAANASGQRQHADGPYIAHNGMIFGNRDPGRHITKVKTIGWEPTCE